MTLATAAMTGTHGELDCADAEAMLHEATMENGNLRTRLTFALESQDVMESETDSMRLDSNRVRALLADVTRKNAHLIDERDDLAAQNKFLHEELAATETDAVPEGTMLFATLARQEMVAEYRSASRVTRGPLPPSVTTAVDQAGTEITSAMTEAGREAMKAVIRREVRRRRRRTQTRHAHR